MTDQTKIRAALELLRIPRPHVRRKHSWVKRTTHTAAGGHCVLGALERVGADNLWSGEDVKAIHQVIIEQFPGKRYHSIPQFNDEVGRKFEDIELVLEKAAVLREEQGAESDWSLK